MHLEYTIWLIEKGQISEHKESILGSLSMVHCAFHHCCWPNAACGRKNKGSEGSMLYFQDSLLVCMSLFVLMLFVQGWEGGVAAAWRVRVEHPNIKKCELLPVTPKSLCTYISTSSIFHVGSPVL